MSDILKHSILLVEDDPNLGIVIEDFLDSSGFKVVLASTGAEASSKFKNERFDIALLDVMLPDTDGFTLASELRRRQPELPLIFLTARSMPEDKITGLKIGADDYITKPFQPEELKLRIEAVLRRYLLSPKTINKARKFLKIGHFRFYPGQLILKYGEIEYEITATESALLMLLIDERNGLVSRDKAFQKVWGIPDDAGSRNLDVYIGKIRKLLSSDPSIKIKSVHGKGYKLEF